ncbi:MAG: hypothetical protein AAF636_17980 [Pseudomonadota bacterium]
MVDANQLHQTNTQRTTPEANDASLFIKTTKRIVRNQIPKQCCGAEIRQKLMKRQCCPDETGAHRLYATRPRSENWVYLKNN